MAWFRRRGRRKDGESESRAESLPVLARPTEPLQASDRTERLVFALAAHAHQIEQRLVHLEHAITDDRVSRAREAAYAVTQEDLIELQAQTSRVAADLARLRVEVAAQQERLRRAAEIAERVVPFPEVAAGERPPPIVLGRPDRSSTPDTDERAAG